MGRVPSSTHFLGSLGNCVPFTHTIIALFVGKSITGGRSCAEDSEATVSYVSATKLVRLSTRMALE